MGCFVLYQQFYGSAEGVDPFDSWARFRSLRAIDMLFVAGSLVERERGTGCSSRLTLVGLRAEGCGKPCSGTRLLGKWNGQRYKK